MKRPKPIHRAKSIFHRPTIQSVVREQTAGGIVYRRDKKNAVEILLIQDAKNRWTIPKGHIEEGEKADHTARREVAEETGLKNVHMHAWLGKVHFRYRRQSSLILITMQVYLVEVRDHDQPLIKEDWMNGIKWFPAMEALDKIEYEDIGKLILLAMKRIRNNKLN
jgi:8-oxo-dGTP pyrophosphatase MutT (NUDIX family)